VDLPVEQIFIFFLNYSSIWRLLSAEYVHLNEIAVPLLINSIIYESGRTTFWNLVEKDFTDSNWKVRMQAGN